MCQVHTATFIVLLAPENTDYTACHPEKRLPRIHYTWYLSLRMLTSDASQLQKRKEKKKNREGRKGASYSDSRSPCVPSRSRRSLLFFFFFFLILLGIHCSYLLWAIYMAVSMLGHGDLTGLLISPNGFIVTLWAPTA